MLIGSKQSITFVDPKGLRNLRGPEDPKIGFHRVIKDVERRLGDPDVLLNSFIVAPTRHREVTHWEINGKQMSIADFKARNVYFQADERASYIGEILASIAGPAGS